MRGSASATHGRARPVGGAHGPLRLQDGDQSHLSNLRALRENLLQAKLAIAGGIDLETIDALKYLDPEIIIVGKAISLADDPGEVARLMHLKLSDE